MVDTTNKKYENTVLYLCTALGGSIRGKKKLAKLLYYIDFDRYAYKESTKSVTGDTYLAWKMGPVPKHYNEVLAKLESRGLVKVHSVDSPDNYLPTEVYSATTQPDMTLFDADDRLIMERVVKKYGALTGKQLEDLPHAEAPFIATEQSQDIAYDLVFYRGTDFSDTVATT